MWRFLRAIGYYFKGILNRRAEKLAENVNVQAATFDESIEKQDDRYSAKLESVSSLTLSIKTKEKELEGLADACGELEKAVAGAKLSAEKRKTELLAAGKSAEEVKADATILKAMTAFNLAQNGLKTKQERIAKLTVEIKAKEAEKAKALASLTSISAKKRALEEEKDDTIAAIQDAKAKEEEEKNKAGITKDTSDEDLAVARKARLKIVARAEAAAEANGANIDSSMEEFIQAGEQSTNDSAFMDMLGLNNETTEKLEPAKLPEN